MLKRKRLRFGIIISNTREGSSNIVKMMFKDIKLDFIEVAAAVAATINESEVYCLDKGDDCELRSIELEGRIDLLMTEIKNRFNNPNGDSGESEDSLRCRMLTNFSRNAFISFKMLMETYNNTRGKRGISMRRLLMRYEVEILYDMYDYIRNIANACIETVPENDLCMAIIREQRKALHASVYGEISMDLSRVISNSRGYQMFDVEEVLLSLPGGYRREERDPSRYKEYLGELSRSMKDSPIFKLPVLKDDASCEIVATEISKLSQKIPRVINALYIKTGGSEKGLVEESSRILHMLELVMRRITGVVNFIYFDIITEISVIIGKTIDAAVAAEIEYKDKPLYTEKEKTIDLNHAMSIIELEIHEKYNIDGFGGDVASLRLVTLGYAFKDISVAIKESAMEEGGVAGRLFTDLHKKLVSDRSYDYTKDLLAQEFLDVIPTCVMDYIDQRKTEKSAVDIKCKGFYTQEIKQSRLR